MKKRLGRLMAAAVAALTAMAFWQPDGTQPTGSYEQFSEFPTREGVLSAIHAKWAEMKARALGNPIRAVTGDPLGSNCYVGSTEPETAPFDDQRQLRGSLA